jgi:predicted dinucleotide-binding enzyme
MKTGIIGSAAVGQTLAKAFTSEGYDVMLGTRNTSKAEMIKFKNEHAAIQIGTFNEAAAFGEILVLATGGSVTEEAIKLAGIENFDNKVVIDATNPIAPAPPQNGVLKFFTGPEDSLMERVQKLIPGAKVVKAFNSVGNRLMYKPKLQGGTPSMFICGNDDAAKKVVTDILSSFGWETEDLGKIEAARAIEQLCILWCIPGFLQNDWMHAYKVLRPA